MSTATETSWVQQDIDIGSGLVSVRKKGSGPALWCIPRDNGHPPGDPFLDSLAESYTVYAPALPGFSGGRASDWTWASNVRDVATVLSAAIRRTGTTDNVLLGLGFGGWIALEMLAADPTPFTRAVLVSPLGVRPVKGMIFDQFLVNAELYARRMFHDEANFRSLYGELATFEQLFEWEDDREMSSRVAWKPLMNNPSLLPLLPSVAIPVTIVHGENDHIVPVEASEMIANAIPGASLVRVPNCGYAADIESPASVRQAIG